MTREARAGWAMSAPALAAIAAFFVAPTAGAFVLSLTDFDIYALADPANLRFVGLGNYIRLAGDPTFWSAVGNSLWLVAIGVPTTLIVSLAAAILLDAPTLGWKPLWRVAFFAPYVTTLVATAVVWRYLLHGRYGPINAALGGVGVAPVDWLGQPGTALAAILAFTLWKTFGYGMVIFLAALQTVPHDLHDAARIDGATAWARFRHVTWPAIAPTTTLVAILSIVTFFQLFAEPYVMTRGGPGRSTVTMLYFLYEEGFQWWNLGVGSAVAFLLFALILGLTGVPLLVARRMAGR